jgi:hypothetical protein
VKGKKEHNLMMKRAPWWVTIPCALAGLALASADDGGMPDGAPPQIRSVGTDLRLEVSEVGALTLPFIHRRSRWFERSCDSVVTSVTPPPSLVQLSLKGGRCAFHNVCTSPLSCVCFSWHSRQGSDVVIAIGAETYTISEMAKTATVLSELEDGIAAVNETAVAVSDLLFGRTKRGTDDHESEEEQQGLVELTRDSNVSVGDEPRHSCTAIRTSSPCRTRVYSARPSCCLVGCIAQSLVYLLIFKRFDNFVVYQPTLSINHAGRCVSGSLGQVGGADADGSGKHNARCSAVDARRL